MRNREKRRNRVVVLVSLSVFVSIAASLIATVIARLVAKKQLVGTTA